jgi:non-homologous end joining protein Ku/predicted RNase H-like HicB family nuclease
MVRSLMHAIALIHHEAGTYGVSFPDFPGCTTVARDLDSAIVKAGEVLAFHAEGLAEDGPLPRLRGLNELRGDPRFREAAKDAVWVLIPYEPPRRAVRVNITLEETLLGRIDHSAAAASETRSGYLASAARLRMDMSEEPPTRLSASHRAVVATGLAGPWRGYLKLSLVACPISLYPAFHPSQYEDFGVARSSSEHTIDIEAFVPRAQLDVRYLDKSFYVVPNESNGQQAFAVIRDAMRGKDMLAAARIVLPEGDRVIALATFGKGMVGTILRYADEVRDPEQYLNDVPEIKLQQDMLKLAEHILESKKRDFDASMLQAPLRAKPSAAPRAPSNVINLMDALRRSAQGGRKSAK